MKGSKVLTAIDELTKAVKGKTLTTDQVAEMSNFMDEVTKKLESVEYKHGPDYLLVKWGGWKSWNSENKEIQELFKKHDALGLNVSAMLQHESPEQTEIMCQIVDLIDGVIQNDWDGEYYTKERAKEYLRGYSAS